MCGGSSISGGSKIQFIEHPLNVGRSWAAYRFNPFTQSVEYWSDSRHTWVESTDDFSRSESDVFEHYSGSAVRFDDTWAEPCLAFDRMVTGD